MKFAIVSVLVLALEIVDAVGDIRGLLDLCHATASADGVDASCGDEENIALVDLISGEGLGDSVVFYHLLIRLGGDLLLQTTIELGTGFTRQTIPHLGLATVLAMTMGNLVVGVYLDAQVALGIDELDEQRELVAEALIIVLAHEFFSLFTYQLVEALAFF